jgi:quercetin dioxygenase-like cupin family protein
MANRIVTGWSDAGQPVTLFRDATPTLDFGATQASELWVTHDAPADAHVREDSAAGEWQLEPPPGGSAFRVVTFQPGAEVDVHATATVDCIVVVSGELTLILPEEELTLRAGDTLVQQATPHGWANRSAELCVIAVVLLSAREEAA